MPTPEQHRKRMRPEYVAQRVDELPEDVTQSRKGPRTAPEFTEAMLVAQGDPNVWYCVATYKSDNGAKTMAKKIEAKSVRLPAGDWELETRRIEAPNGDGRWSRLFAKFLG